MGTALHDGEVKIMSTDNKRSLQQRLMVDAEKLSCKYAGTRDFGMTSKGQLALVIRRIHIIINLQKEYMNKIGDAIDKYGASKIIHAHREAYKQFLSDLQSE